MSKKVIEGTKARKEYQVVKGQKDTRQVRCKCGSLASQVPDGQGGFVYACTCGKRFTFSAI